MKRFLKWFSIVSSATLLGMGLIANAAPITPIYGGGTGTSTSPTDGYLLIGSGGQYTFIASSSLKGGGSGTAVSTTINSASSPFLTFTALINGNQTATLASVLSLNGATGTLTISTSTGSGNFDFSRNGTAFTLTIPSNVGYFTNDANYINSSTIGNYVGVASSTELRTPSGTILTLHVNQIYDDGATTTQCLNDPTGLLATTTCVSSLNNLTGKVIATGTVNQIDVSSSTGNLVFSIDAGYSPSTTIPIPQGNLTIQYDNGGILGSVSNLTNNSTTAQLRYLGVGTDNPGSSNTTGGEVNITNGTDTEGFVLNDNNITHNNANLLYVNCQSVTSTQGCATINSNATSSSALNVRVNGSLNRGAIKLDGLTTSAQGDANGSLLAADAAETNSSTRQWINLSATHGTNGNFITGTNSGTSEFSITSSGIPIFNNLSGGFLIGNGASQVSVYGGSTACNPGNAVTTISGTGVTTCSGFATVTTVANVLANNFPLYTTTASSSLSATSSLSMLPGGALNASSSFIVQGTSSLQSVSSTNQTISGYLTVTGQTIVGSISSTRIDASAGGTIVNISSTRLDVSTGGIFANLSSTNITASGYATIGGALTQSGALNSLASTTINGNATTTNLTITSLANQNCLGTGAGGVMQAGTCSGGGGGVPTSSKYFYVMTPGNSTLPNTNFPSLTKNSGTNWVDRTLDFGNGASSSAYWQFPINASHTVASATLQIAWRAFTGGTASTTNWTANYNCTSTGNLWDTANSRQQASTTATNTANSSTIITTLTLASSTFTPNEECIFQVQRNVSVESSPTAITTSTKFMSAILNLAW